MEHNGGIQPMNKSITTIRRFWTSLDVSGRYMFGFILILAVLLIPALSSAHRTAHCDGQKSVRISLQGNGIVQIETTEPITGVYPGTPQKQGFTVYDKGRPRHLFRIDGAMMVGEKALVHVNTIGHQCLLRVRKSSGKSDSVVTLVYPQSLKQMQLSLPRALRESPVRNLWFTAWLIDKEGAPPGVKVENVQQDINRWVEGLKVEMKYHYTMPGFVGFTQLLSNISEKPILINPSELFDEKAPHHSISITDTLGLTSILHPSGDLHPGQQALLHIFYKRKRGK